MRRVSILSANSSVMEASGVASTFISFAWFLTVHYNTQLWKSALCEVTDATVTSQVLASQQPDNRIKGSTKDKTKRILIHLLHMYEDFLTLKCVIQGKKVKN